MPFENYQKQSNDNSRYVRIGYTVIAAFIFIPVFIFVFGFYESNDPQTHAISLPDEAAAQSVEQLCASLPMPEKLEFMSKSEPKNDYEQHLVIYDYRSTRRPEEILPAFLLWFSENGWQRVDGTDSTFRKGRQSVFIWAITNAYGNQINYYNIYCSEKK